MLLSEAIRLGSLLGPQLHGVAFGPNDSSCALGAAALALGLHYPVQESWLAFGSVPRTLLTAFPGLNETTPAGLTLASLIVRLNDLHEFTREQIADWLVNNGYDCESVGLPAVTQMKEVACV